MSNNKSINRVVTIVTPIIVLVVCACIMIVLAIKPYNALSKYLNLAFMDDMKVTSATQGLIITENDIDTNYTGETSSTGEVIYPTFGEQYAVLNCPTASISVPVYWGSNSTLLEKGACQSSASAVIGDSGNSVIDAHVNTYFANLDSLQVGDTVTVTTTYGEFIYTVTEKIEFEKTNKSYVNPTTDNRLTLYTCKMDVLGSSDIRIGAVCTLTESRFYTNVTTTTDIQSETQTTNS